ncbi:ribulose-phosphate 3-epimerase [Mesomycoplasma neurolyticum]|uniref:D-ribulose-5-phosphate 3 epimerase n=1 Tax=Mesomycoplasma neurolyticum TaxID=2120 RepID=A0A449A5I2_9BACT|nr:ribulose-phosphate 3-epimerase [Mesomycoplasma neurolyticum]VEU59521.1 d-ribulose-5-phosphate 3 epimerase [Mesomycoplasma neurolyticum]
MKKISPSLLSLAKDQRIETAFLLIKSKIDWIHYDYMDAKFVPNRAIEIDEIANIKKHVPKHIMDIHIMAFNPEIIIEKSINLVDYATIHYEAFENKNNILNLIKKYEDKIKIGLSIKPETPFEQIIPFLKKIKLLLIMSVEPGAGGQSFIFESLDKIKKAKQYIKDNNLDVIIQVDGGINDKTAKLCFESGADVLVSGSYLTLNFSVKKLNKLLS